MANETFTDERIIHIMHIAQQMQPTFGKKPVGGAGDNSDIIEAIKRSDEKRKLLSKEEQKLFDKLRQDIDFKGPLDNLSQVITASGDSKEYAVFTKKLAAMSEKQYDSRKKFAADLEKLGVAAEKAGTTLDKEGIKMYTPLRNMNQKQIHIIKDGINISKKKQAQAERNIAVIDGVIEAQKGMSDGFHEAHGKVKFLGNAIKTVAKDFIKYAEQEQRFAQASATADASWLDGMMKMGISQIAYMKILKDTRHQSLAANSAGVDFKGSLQTSTESLQGLTGNYEEAAQGAARFHKNMSLIGVSQANLGDAVAEQTTMYENNYRALALTVDEFNNLTAELINNQDTRSVLLGLQEDERKAYVLGLQQRQAEYMTMGYTIERAKELQKTFQALNKQNPKERMKAAAKERQMMAVMGMAKEGARLFDLQVRYRTMSADQKIDADKEMTQIRGAGAKKFGSMSGSGASMAQAFSMQTIGDKLGYTPIADTFEKESGLALKVNKDQLAKTNEISGFIKEILGKMSIWDAMKGSSIGSVVTGALTIGGGLIVGLLTKKLGMSMAAKMAGKYAGKSAEAAKLAADALKATKAGAATAAAEAAFKTAAPKAGVGAVKAGVAGVGAAATAVGAGGKMAGKIAGGVAKGAGKAALKAIPGIGLIVSLGLMGARIAEGDYLGAGMELVSGAAGLIPGVGTAASIGMSTAIVARDLNKKTPAEKAAADAADAANAPAQEKASDPAMTQSGLMLQLNTTLVQIHDYLLATTEANSDQSQALGKTATAISESLRYNNLPGGRAS